MVPWFHLKIYQQALGIHNTLFIQTDGFSPSSQVSYHKIENAITKNILFRANKCEILNLNHKSSIVGVLASEPCDDAADA